jgi:single-strand DNA-binding protein
MAKRTNPKATNAETLENPAVVETIKPVEITTIVGRLGRDVEVRAFDSGKQVARSSLAAGFGQNTEPTWYQIEAWDKLAERLKQCFKGQRIALTGKLIDETYTDKSGANCVKQVFKVKWIDLVASA